MHKRLSILAIAMGCSGSSELPTPDAAPDPDACVPANGPTVTHGQAITGDETWPTGIHIVAQTIAVTGGTLTIAPCTEVRLAPDASIELANTATALVARGTDQDPITFVRQTTDSPWGHLSSVAPAELSFAHATLTGGGTTGDYKTAEQLGSTIVTHGNAMLPQLLAVDHVTIDGSTAFGIFLDASRFTTGSTQLAITHAGAYPLFLGADSATELPDGAYTGNAIDQILLQSVALAASQEQGRPLTANATLHDRGVPYRVGLGPAEISVGDSSAAATLTIEAGVTIELTPQGATGTSRIRVRGGATAAGGSLVVAGTAAKPVTFTSAAVTPLAGDWQGIEFRGVLDPASKIDHAILDYAGARSFSSGVCGESPTSNTSTSDAALIISLPTGSPTELLTNSTISHSAMAAVYRDWTVDDVDFRPTNTFDHIVGCVQSNVPTAGHSCPITACPVAP